MKSWDDLLWWNSEEKRDCYWNVGFEDDYYPHYDRWYRALELTPFDKVKVVILGQDPYHDGNANGLCFSVDPHHQRLPPSLRNIFTEYSEDLGFPRPRNGDLSSWAMAGVLLLNTALTVERSNPGTHGEYWEPFTREVISSLNDHRKDLVFLLWGRHAQAYHPFIRATRHHVIRSPHPSPYSARTGFFGSKPFSRANSYLTSKGLEPVNWRLA